MGYVRRYDRQWGGLFDTLHLSVLVVAVVIIVFSAIYDQARHPHGVARPACEYSGGTWTKIGERNRHDVMACRYRITGRIREAP